MLVDRWGLAFGTPVAAGSASRQRPPKAWGRTHTCEGRERESFASGPVARPREGVGYERARPQCTICWPPRQMTMAPSLSVVT